MPIDVSLLHLWVTYAIIAVAITSYALDRLSLELTSLGVLGGMLLFFHFVPLAGPDGENVMSISKVLAGFSDPALVAIVSLLIVAQGLIQTGALDEPVAHILRFGNNRPGPIILFSLVTVALVSAFLNDTPVVVIFIPIMAALAEKLGRPARSIMMPLSFAAIFGGMTTLIGTSTNLLVAGTFEGLTNQKIGFFDFTVPGLVLVSVGLVYMFALAPRILGVREESKEGITNGSGKQFISQLEISAGNPLIGQQPVAGIFPALPDVTVRAIRRGRQLLVPPYEDIALEEGDSIVLAATRKTLTNLASRNPSIVSGNVGPASTNAEGSSQAIPGGDRILAEVVVAPASRMEGRTIEQTGFRDQTRCIVFGIQRRSRMSRSGFDEIRLEAGDVLLVLGKRDDVMNLREQRDVLLMEWSTQELPVKTKARVAAAIFAGVVISAASGLMPITISGVVGATLMIATGCLNIRQAARAVNRRIVMIIAAALAMGTALQATGGAEYLAYWLAQFLGESSPAMLLSGYFLLVAFVTNILTNNATAVLFTPIAVSLATMVNVEPTIFVYATIFAANCAFATPMAYQTNLLVMGPGQYQFRDFMRVGVPLALLIWITFSLFAPWYFGLSW